MYMYMYSRSSWIFGFVYRQYKDKMTSPRIKCESCDVASGLKICGACHCVKYCSEEHQKKDWQTHKSYCMG